MVQHLCEKTERSNRGKYLLIRPDTELPTPESHKPNNLLPLRIPQSPTAHEMSSEQPPQLLGQGQESSQPPRSQKSMTKAERRELQEKQRAAKAAAKASGSIGQTNKSVTKQPEGGGEKSSGKQSGKQGPGSGSSTQPHTQHQRRASRVGPISGEIILSGGGPGGNIASDLASRSVNPRGVRIFSHFGLQHRSGAGKGLIHPAIVRLGLLFSDFQITGANARCLATLITFKHVRTFQFLACFLIRAEADSDFRLSKTTPRPRTTHCPGI